MVITVHGQPGTMLVIIGSEEHFSADMRDRK